MSSTQEQAAAANADPSGTLKTSASIYLPLLAAGLLAFECLRRCCRTAYDPRDADARDGSFWPTTMGRTGGRRAKSRPFGWMRTVWSVSDDEIMERCGLDTLSFLRFLRLGQKIALLAVALSAVLFPLYATAKAPTLRRTHVDPVTQLSMSNVPANDNRLWASTTAAFIVSLFALYLILQEYRTYIAWRHELLGRADAQQYSILVNDIPTALRTRQALGAYIDKVFPGAVRDVYIAVECSELESYVSEREKVRDKLEHALATLDATGKRPRHHDGRSFVGMLKCRKGSFGRSVDSITAYEEQLNVMNQRVESEVKSIEKAQRRLDAQVGDSELSQLVSSGANTDDDKKPFFSQSDDMFARRSSADYLSEDNEEVNDRDLRRQEHEMTQNERDAARKENPMRVMRRAAFISFTSLKSAQVAQQALQVGDSVSLAVTPAPHVDDVKWENIGLAYRTRAAGTLVSSAISAAIVIFWTIPTAFVASLATVESLRRSLPFLNKAFDQYPILQEIFKQLAPLALAVLKALAPVVFGLLSAREGHPSTTEVRASLFTKLAWFQLVQIFFVLVIAGTIFDSIKDIIDQPKLLINMLGHSMPQQSTFFISYVLVLTGLTLVLELLRVVPAVLSVLFFLLAPKRTRREREAKWIGLRYIAFTDPFDPTSPLADAFLVLLVTLTFASIAPLVCYFTGLYFLVAELIYRRQVLYVYQSTSFALGAFWPRLYKFLIVALVVAQLTMIGLLSLKKVAIQSVLVLVLIGVILLFHYYVERLFPRVAKYLPLADCVHLDSVRGRRDPNATFYFLDNVYRQPAMMQRGPVRPDYRMIGDEDDEYRHTIVSEDDDQAQNGNRSL